jgi:hypothetical protein
MSDETSLWIGASGAKYTYYVYERHPDIPKRMGIFIYSKKNKEDLWVPVFMDEGDLSVRSNADPELMTRINAKGATHVLLRVNTVEADRRGEIADLLKRYENAFEPDGCHIRDKGRGGARTEMSDETSLWIGASGAEYTYYVHERHPDIPKRMGTFIYSKKNQEDLWVPVFIGEGDLSVRANADSELMTRINAKGATHVLLRINSVETDRRCEIADLLNRYQNAFEPEGCHVRDVVRG